MRNRRRAGFTLIEVLLVIAILGMMAALVVPKLMKTGDQARVDLVASQLGRSGPFATSLNLFKLRVGRFPTSEEGLKALIERPSSIEETSGKWNGPYLESADMLIDPWANPYGFKAPGDVNTDGYDLWSNGPDGQEGTDDDIRNWKTDK